MAPFCPRFVEITRVVEASPVRSATHSESRPVTLASVGDAICNNGATEVTCDRSYAWLPSTRVVGLPHSALVGATARVVAASLTRGTGKAQA